MLTGSKIGHGLEPVFRGPILRRDQDGRCAIGERRRVCRRQRAVLAIENWLELRDFCKVDIRSEIIVAEDAGGWNQKIVKKARIVGRGGLFVALISELILSGPADMPFL